MKLALAILLGLTILPASAKSADDPILNAITDELERTTHRLQLPGHPKPYYVSYRVRDSQTRKISGAFGAITDDDEDHSRTLDTDVRVGDYKLDSSTSLSNGIDFSRIMSHSRHQAITTDNNYNAIRRDIWLQTDSAYKRAIENLEANDSYLRQNTVEDRPDSFSKAKAFVHIEPSSTLDVNADQWRANIRDLSGIFKNYPIIRTSSVSLSCAAENRWYLNNEGFRYRTGETGFSLTVDAQAQAPDGTKISDEETFPGYHENELPSKEELEKATIAMADRLKELAAAPMIEDYRGPVLFEGQAGAEFFHQLLDSKLVTGQNSVRAMLGGDAHDKPGKRLLPKFISVVDDPQAKEYKGQILYGTYKVDDEGVEGEKVTLVDKGILKTLCSSRVPTRYSKESNGHCHAGGGATSNLFILSENKLSHEALKARLIDLGKEDALKEVYIVRKLLTSPSELDSSTIQSIMRAIMPGAGGAALYPPVLLYRVSTEDGHEELVRGGVFTNLSGRTLRDIEATGDDSKAYPVLATREITSIIAPSVLVKEVEMLKLDRISSRGPVLKNPYFEKK